MDSQIYQQLLGSLNAELVPALGCTEPICIAFAAAKARDVLKGDALSMEVLVSGNILKNVKSVIVPNTCGQKGIDVAAVVGYVAGDSALGLEALRNVSTKDLETVKRLIDSGFCSVGHLRGSESLHVIVTLKNNDGYAKVEIKGGHTLIVKIEKNEEVVFSNIMDDKVKEKITLSVLDIYNFACEVAISDIEEVISRQIDYNSKIAQEGLNHLYGVNLGTTLLAEYGNDVKVRAKAYAAAGSDARMSGCELPVIINSGSGNQGMTVSLPVIEYYKELKCPKEELYRALVLSNLIAIHLKRGIGKLSAYCGVVSAACGCGAGITFLHTKNFKHIAGTISNTLANVSGIVCDGAKPSCAAKIASSVDAAIMAHSLSMKNTYFNSGDGIIKEDIEKTIKSVSRLGKEGMRETDIEILSIMLEDYNLAK